MGHKQMHSPMSIFFSQNKAKINIDMYLLMEISGKWLRLSRNLRQKTRIQNNNARDHRVFVQAIRTDFLINSCVGAENHLFVF